MRKLFQDFAIVSRFQWTESLEINGVATMFKSNVTLSNFQWYHLQQCCDENCSSVTSHCRDWLTWQNTGNIFVSFWTPKTHLFSGYTENRSQWHVTLHQFLWQHYIHVKSLEKIVQCNISFMWGVYDWCMTPWIVLFSTAAVRFWLADENMPYHMVVTGVLIQLRKVLFR